MVILVFFIVLACVILGTFVYLFKHIRNETRFDRFKYTDGTVKLVDRRVSSLKDSNNPIGYIDLIHEVRGYEKRICYTPYFDDGRCRTMSLNQMAVAFNVYEYILKNKIKNISIEYEFYIRMHIMYKESTICIITDTLEDDADVRCETERIIKRINRNIDCNSFEGKNEVLMTTRIKDGL